MGRRKISAVPSEITGAQKNTDTSAKTKSTRSYLNQSDVPAYALNDALVIAQAIFDNYGGHATSPIDVASALQYQPGSAKFRMLCGASIAYGLTDGGYNAQTITATDLAKRIIQPLEDDDDINARCEALLKPRIINEFLNKYNGSPVPRQEIGLNVLKSMGVPADRVEVVWELILKSADEVGYIRNIKGKEYVHLVASRSPSQVEKVSDQENALEEGLSDKEIAATPSVQANTSPQRKEDSQTKRVFITHGKNTTFIDPIKKLLAFGEMMPVVSAEKQTVSQPVPDKVLEDMRSCQSAIIHIDSEQVLIDTEAKEHTVINPNVLIEIGAAMALYGRRFILLVKNGTQLPSNLQGLYEVRYNGTELDGDATIRLLEAINSMKKTPLPD